MRMMYAPKGCPGIQFGAEWFAADEQGVVKLPDEYADTAKQHGFTDMNEAGILYARALCEDEQPENE